MGFDLLTFSQLLDNIFHNIVYYMVTLIINGCSDKLSETTFIENIMENNKGLLNQSTWRTWSENLMG